MRSKILSLLVVMATLLSGSVRAQENSLNVFSVYSMYGLGILDTQGTSSTISMGGAGVASRSRTTVNMLNPASYSTALSKGILMEFGVDGSMYNSSQVVDAERLSSRSYTANFHDIALQIPVAKGLGVGFSLSPYASSGYQISDSFLTDTADFVQYVFQGSGTVTLVKFGVGWEVAKRLSIGLAGQYYWGNLDREFSAVTTNIITPGTAISAAGVDNTSISRMKAQVGVQWAPYVSEKGNESLTLGATFDLGGDLNPRYARVVSGSGYDDYEIFAQNDTTKISVVLPRQLSVGATYNSSKLTLSLDYTYQNWVNGNEDVVYTSSGADVVYNNVHQLRLGAEYVPNRMDVRKYMRRMSYRGGVRYGGYQYTFGGEKIPQYAITGGVSFPLNMIGISRINLGAEWGGIGSTKDITIDSGTLGLVRTNYLKLSLGITLFGDDYWFQRPQID